MEKTRKREAVVLMCPPRYFRIGTEDPALNPYMNTNIQPDHAEMMLQFKKLVRLYSEMGIQTCFLPPQEELFDQVFTANIAWGVADTFVMANLRPEWRRKETEIAAAWLAANGYKTVSLPPGIFFEGQGDIVTTKDAYLYCYGVRNSLEAIDEIKKLLPLEKPVIPLRLVSPKMYHGDVCIRYLGPEPDKILWFPGAFDEESNRAIERLSSQKFAVDGKFIVQELENGRRNFLLNGVYHKNMQTFPWDETAGEFPENVRRFVEDSGQSVVTLNFSEFGLSGAGHRCCTLFLK